MFEFSPSLAVVGPSDPDGSGADEVAMALRAVQHDERAVGARKLSLAALWADLHGPESVPDHAVSTLRGRTRLVPGGADGTPEVVEFAAGELGCYLETSTVTARALVRDALNLRHRHPLLWRLVLDLRVPEWQARLVARKCAEAELTLAEARLVDSRTSPDLAGLPCGRALSVVEAAVISVNSERAEARRQAAAQRRYVGAGRANEFGLRTLIAQTVAGDVARFDAMVHRLAEIMAEQGDTDPVDVRRAKAIGILAAPATACLMLADVEPEPSPDPVDEPGPPSAVELANAFGRQLRQVDPAKLVPRAVLYVHLHQSAVSGLGGVARMEGVGPLTVEQVREFLGHTNVVVRPVLDVADRIPVDAYEFTGRTREQVLLRQPIDVFPYGTTSARACDLDHSIPYSAGPPGQTNPDNAGPLSRGHHRLKTHATGWRHLQPLPGTYLWRTPQGHWLKVDHKGTTYLGTVAPTLGELHFAALLAA